ncbi:InlB B-repeat-containing protein [Bifidobacterium pseudocatenulatum]|uniref:InlB B-repeat-containing protein n=1 Tax=Bifidobacterium pseudocatenulatum TaxID=28026 RepID=UPI003CFD732C
MSFSKKIIAGVAAVATLAALAPAVAMAEGDAPATQQQTQAADAFITVNSNGGTWAGGATGDASASGKVGDKFATFASQLPTISREGYTFAGYSRTKDGSSIISNNDVITKNCTQLWVAWTKNDAKQFNVTVSTNGGTISDGDHKGEAGDIQVSAAQDSVLVNALPQVQRDGYLFAGWSYDKAGKSPIVATDFVSAYTEVYAQWTKQKPVVDAKQFNVVAYTNGATILDGDNKGQTGDIQFKADQDANLLSVLPSVGKDGYTFTGWTYDEAGNSPVITADIITANTVVYAQWVKKVEEAQFFNVKANSNGGTFIDGTDAGCSGDTMVSVKKDDSLVSALPQVQRDGYLFAGWSYDKAGKSPIVATDFVSAYTEVYAQWTKQKPVVDAKQFNVIVSTNGGTIADGDHKGEAGDIQVSAEQDSVLVNALPTVTREGYTFAGWSYDQEGNSKVLDTDFVSANTWVYAQWQEVTKFNVIANTNGGYFANGTTAGDAMVEAVEDGANLVDSLKGEEFPFVRPGYTFAGWSYDQEGNSKVLDTDFVSANTFVYAQWTKTDDSKKDDSKPADTTKKNDTKGNTKKTVAQKIKKAVLGNTGATVGGVAVFAVIALLGFAGITVLRKRA